VLNTGDWIDRPSVGIPYLYVATGMELAEALKQQGKLTQAQAVFNTSKRVASAVRLDELVRGAETEFQQTVGDTARPAQMPAVIGPPPAVPTDSTNKPGAKTAPKKKKT
jgi:hypothetical protein